MLIPEWSQGCYGRTDSSVTISLRNFVGEGIMSNLYRGPFQMLPTKFWAIWPSGFREEDFFKSANQKQESPVSAMSVNGSGRNQQSVQRTFHRCFLPSFGSFGQAVSEKKIFLNLPIRNKNCLWRPCLLMDRDKMCNLQRGPSTDASYQVSVHLAQGFQRRRLKCEKNNGRQMMDAK